MVIKVSREGGVVCPSLSVPQQTAVPSSLRAQVCLPKALTAVKLSPLGGRSSPDLAGVLLYLSLMAQQVIDPFSRRPHMWPLPAVMAVRTGCPQAASPVRRTAAVTRAVNVANALFRGWTAAAVVGFPLYFGFMTASS